MYVFTYFLIIHMKQLLFFICLLLGGLPLQAQTAISPSYMKKIDLMLEKSGAAETVNATFKQLMPLMKAQAGAQKVPEDIWVKVEKEFCSIMSEELTSISAEVYSKYFSEKELDEIIAFYESPVGRKVGLHSAAMSQETSVLTQERLRPIIATRLKAIFEKAVSQP